MPTNFPPICIQKKIYIRSMVMHGLTVQTTAIRRPAVQGTVVSRHQGGSIQGPYETP